MEQIMRPCKQANLRGIFKLQSSSTLYSSMTQMYHDDATPVGCFKFYSNIINQTTHIELVLRIEKFSLCKFVVQSDLEYQ